MLFGAKPRFFCIRTSHTYNNTPPHEWNSMKTAWTILPNVNNVREKIFAEYKIQWHIMIRPLTWKNFPIQRYYFVFKFMCLYMGVCISVIFPGIVGNKCFTSWRDNFFFFQLFRTFIGELLKSNFTMATFQEGAKKIDYITTLNEMN